MQEPVSSIVNSITNKLLPIPKRSPENRCLLIDERGELEIQIFPIKQAKSNSALVYIFNSLGEIKIIDFFHPSFQLVYKFFRLVGSFLTPEIPLIPTHLYIGDETRISIFSKLPILVGNAVCRVQIKITCCDVMKSLTILPSSLNYHNTNTYKRKQLIKYEKR